MEKKIFGLALTIKLNLTYIMHHFHTTRIIFSNEIIKLLNLGNKIL